MRRVARKRILIVDDDADIRDGLAMLLEEHYLVELAEGGRQALAALERMAFDAVLLDVMMPGMDGVEVVEHMRTRGIEVPVALLSAVRDLAGVAHRAGISAFLGKPCTAAQIRSALDRLMQSNGPHGLSNGQAPA